MKVAIPRLRKALQQAINAQRVLLSVQASRGLSLQELAMKVKLLRSQAEGMNREFVAPVGGRWSEVPTEMLEMQEHPSLSQKTDHIQLQPNPHPSSIHVLIQAPIAGVGGL